MKTAINKSKAFGLAVMLLFCSITAEAAQSIKDKHYNQSDARYCVTAIKYYERVYNIPNNLLYAISLVESGRWNDLYSSTMPWPWSVNVEGEPYYFHSKAEAATFIKRKLADGITKMDVGCNQINVHHHGYNFKNVEDMLNPIRNAQYAAQFLHGNYTATKDWTRAVAWYHSKTTDLGNAYVKRVKSMLNRNIQHNTQNNFAHVTPKQHRVSYSVPTYDNAYHVHKYSSQKLPQPLQIKVSNAKNYKSLNSITKKVLQACE